MDTGELIIYTSGDSVMQIAAHEDVIPLEELYDICRYARTLVNGPEYIVGRVIARPFVGPDKDHFTRTANRHDFSLAPTGKTDLDLLHEAGYQVIAIGKTNDIFSGRGIDQSYHNESNMDGMDHVDEVLGKKLHRFLLHEPGRLLTPCMATAAIQRVLVRHSWNLISVLGHVLAALRPDDLLLITADHGNDPCFKGTDHTREEVPLLAWSPKMQASGSLGVRSTYADLGATILDNFGLHALNGQSFLEDLK